MKTRLKITTKMLKNISLDTIRLKNLREMVQKQDERLHTGEYFFKIYEIKKGVVLIKINFYFEDIVLKKDAEKESILKSHFKLDRNSSIEKEQELVRLGRTEATVVLLTNEELIEYSMSKRDFKKLPNLVKQLEEKKCFIKSEIPKIKVNYREVKDNLDLFLERPTLEQVFSGELTEYTIEEVFENKENQDILNMTPIQNSDEVDCHIVYELENIKLISEDVINGLTLPTLDKYAKLYSEIDNLEEFKKNFSIMNMLVL